MEFNEYIKRIGIVGCTGYDMIQTAIKARQRESNLLTLQNIKDLFYAELASDSMIVMSLDQYIREYYIPCYNAELNFIGYELRSN